MKPNNFYIEVIGSGLPEVDGLFVPSTAPTTESESGTISSLGFWNGRMAWDRADGKSARSPSLSYSNTYKSWRISRLDGHLAYHFTCDDDIPPTDCDWEVYKMGVAPAPRVVVHYFDPRVSCPEPNVVFVLGGPGAGKGTMCELAELQLDWVHLSMGNLLREEHQKRKSHATIIQESLTNGRLVPNEIIVTLLKETMERITRTTGKNRFLLDGFPRSMGNLTAWQEVFGQQMDLPLMLYFECPLAELQRRILGRAPFSGRSDDNVESMKLRFETFKAETLPIVNHFKNQGKCREIDTSLNRQAVYELVSQQLAGRSDASVVNRPLCERAEILLGLRPYPKLLS
jgi:UMP-CMP kinase